MQSNYHQTKAHGPIEEDKQGSVVPAVEDTSAPISEETPTAEIVEESVADESTANVDSVVESPVKRDENILIGVVTDCLKLNVRGTPDNDPSGGNVVTTIECLTEVMVDMASSTKEFYKIHTPAGVEGFCMKKYIAIRKQ